MILSAHTRYRHAVAALLWIGYVQVAGAQGAAIKQRDFRSLGTVAPAKLADLALLDAHPLRIPAPVVQVPFTVSNGLIFVQAAIDGHRGRYLLDTGSPLIVLNNAYLRLNPDTYPDPLKTLDTLREGDSRTRHQTFWTVHTFQIGAVRQALDSLDIGPPTPAPGHGNVVLGWGDYLPDQVLGTIGLNALAPFETIVDYTHQRLTLIPLDAAGRRLSPVPAYRAMRTIPLCPYHMHADNPTDTAAHWWGVVARLGSIMDTVMIDTGSQDNILGQETEYQLGVHVRPTSPSPTTLGTPVLLDTMVLAGQTLAGMPFSTRVSGQESSDILGYSFLRRFGVVGFNFRTRQLILYKDAPRSPDVGPTPDHGAGQGHPRSSSITQ